MTRRYNEKKLCKVRALGKICFRSAKVVIIGVLSMPEIYSSTMFIKMNNSNSSKLPIKETRMRPVQNIWETKQPHFHPVLAKLQKIKACAYPTSWNFMRTKQDFSKVVLKVKYFGKLCANQNLGDSIFFDAKFNEMNWAGEIGYSIKTPTTASNQLCDHTEHFPV